MRLTIFTCVLACATAVFAQGPGNGNAPGNGDQDAGFAVVIPGSSVEGPGDVAVSAHTNHLILLQLGVSPATPRGFSPQVISGAYGLPWPSLGGSGTIAIVDAYHYPTAAQDLSVFSSTFGLPAANFQQVSPPGVTPGLNCGWSQEAALDIEWAHAMAPYAKIVLVEAKTNGFSDLLSAVDYAGKLVGTGGGKGEVSMSWGGSEFPGETGYDSHFTSPGVVYFAASGDSGGQTIWPGVSPNAVSAGGTTLAMSGNTFIAETAWNGSGGGPSSYEPRPSYQNVIQSIVGSHRGAPDFSFDANPSTGVAVYDTTSCSGMSGWMVFGGTSVAAPSLAGIVNRAGRFSPSTASELGTIYGTIGTGNYASDFRDITIGSAGRNSARTGWDFVTGVGSDKGLLGK